LIGNDFQEVDTRDWRFADGMMTPELKAEGLPVESTFLVGSSGLRRRGAVTVGKTITSHGTSDEFKIHNFLYGKPIGGTDKLAPVGLIGKGGEFDEIQRSFSSQDCQIRPERS
jgi:hypothetical protein